MLSSTPPFSSSNKQNRSVVSFHFRFSEALLIILVLTPCFVHNCHSSCNQLDHDSLSSFNTTISAAPPLIVDCCSWEGVGCDDSGNVTTLWLPARQLTGKIPPSIMNLTTLSRLNLSHNQLSAPLPPRFFASFIGLHLIDLSFNRLSGDITASNTLPTSIHTFNISSNSFHGTIPTSFLQPAFNLKSFDVSNNSFSGSIPSSICSFTSSLQLLDLSNNDFSGPIPRGFGQCSSLQSLRAGFNFLSGEIPHDIYMLLTLQELLFQGNQLSGVMDERIVGLINLKILALYGNELTGMIPQDIGKLSILEQLLLHINKLNGTIPLSLTNCARLKILNLRVNSLQGQLSSISFSRLVELKLVDLGNNMFSGGLPASLFSCKKLTAIRLASNNLSGEILPNILALESLSFLSLPNNSLSNIRGAIGILKGCKNLSTLILSLNFYDEELPSDEMLIGSEAFQSLRVLALGGSGFTGAIPLWLSKLADLEILDLSFNYLTGAIPGWIGDFQDLFYLDMSNNRLSGNFPIELTRLRRLAFKQNSDLVDRSLELPVFVKPEKVSGLQYNQLSSLPPGLYLGNNGFNGPIPTEIGRLKFIIALHLSGNDFSGSIPDTLSSLTELEKLDLSDNLLSGQIPASLRNLHFLSSFNVAYNNLEGPLPTGGQFDTFPLSSFEGNRELCGPFLQHLCSKNTDDPSQSAVVRGTRKKTLIGVILVICSGIFAMTALVYCLFEKWRSVDAFRP